MIDPVRELKVRAERLHRSLSSKDQASLARLRALPEHRKTDDAALEVAAATLQRKHCLAIVAREWGFSSWDHARRVLEGDPKEMDLGTLLSGPGWSATFNIWFSTYDEAKETHREVNSTSSPRYLLAYKRQLFITESSYIESLGLDPVDPDWQAIGWDWARPRSMAARTRLYAKVIEAERTMAPAQRRSA
jgi:hypothetical protein